MSELKIVDMKGAPVGRYEIEDKLLVLDKGSQAVHDVVLATLAGRRAGTASTLRKGEVAGSNKKPWRQKGTGRARAGLKQSPVWRGGGVAFGPHPRSYAVHVNRKVARLAFRRAFSEKIKAGAVTIVEPMEVAEAKTRLVAAVLKALKLEKPTLWVMNKLDGKMLLAARNLPGVEVTDAGSVNVYQLLQYPEMLVDKAGIETLVARLKAGGGAGEAKAS